MVTQTVCLSELCVAFRKSQTNSLRYQHQALKLVRCDADFVSLPQPQNIFLPFVFESVHVTGPKDSLQGAIARWIRLLMRLEFAIKPDQQTSLLQVVTEISRLGIMRTAAVIIKIG